MEVIHLFISYIYLESRTGIDDFFFTGWARLLIWFLWPVGVERLSFYIISTSVYTCTDEGVLVPAELSVIRCSFLDGITKELHCLFKGKCLCSSLILWIEIHSLIAKVTIGEFSGVTNRLNLQHCTLLWSIPNNVLLPYI